MLHQLQHLGYKHSLVHVLGAHLDVVAALQNVHIEGLQRVGQLVFQLNCLALAEVLRMTALPWLYRIRVFELPQHRTFLCLDETAVGGLTEAFHE